MMLNEILNQYRFEEPLNKRTEIILSSLQKQINCEACTLFIFDEYRGSLGFLSGTNIKSPASIPTYDSNSTLWKMFKSEKATKINIIRIKDKYPRGELFFENINILKSIAYSPIFDDKNNRIGVLRLLNRISKSRKIISFFILAIFIFAYSSMQ